ncbi:MAG: MFS transporter [Blastocatellia bacterium]
MTKLRPSLLLLLLTYAGFFSLGMPDGLLGVAWPAMRSTFGLPLGALGSLLALFTTGYLTASLLSSWLLTRLSVGSLLTLSCLATSASLFGYAIAPRWLVLIACGFLGGLGAGAIDAGLSIYVANFHTARTSNWLHASYGFATTTGPALMTAAMASGRSWQFGYAAVAATQFALALCFGLSRKFWPASLTPDDVQVSTAPPSSSHSKLWQLPAAWLSVAIFIVYTGIESAAGAWPFTLFTESRGISRMTAGTWASVYWGCFTAGRILSGLAANRISTRWLMRFSIFSISIGAILLWVNLTSLLSFVGVALIGLGCAPIYPTMIVTTPDRIAQRFVAAAIGLQISAAVIGQSALPSLVGVLAGRFGLEVLPPTLLIAAILLLALSETLFAKSSSP